MRTRCFYCEKVMEVDDSRFGQIIDCEACGRKFRVQMYTGPAPDTDETADTGDPPDIGDTGDIGDTSPPPPDPPKPPKPKRQVKRRGQSMTPSFRQGAKKARGGGRVPPPRPPAPKKPKRKRRYGCLIKLAILILMGFAFDYYFFRPGRIIQPEVHQQAAALESQLASAVSEVEQREKKFDNLKKSDSFSFFAPYAQRENWAAKFTEARDQLTQLTQRFNANVTPILKRNKREESHQAEYNMAQIRPKVSEALKISHQPAERMAFLENVRDKAPEFVSEAEKNLKDIDKIIADLQPVIKGAKDEFPERAPDIDKRFEPLARLQTDSRTALEAAKRELAKHQTEQSADYARLGDQSVFVKNALANLRKQDPAFRSKIGELAQSYVKILSDMRLDHFAVVKREAWDNYYDYPTSHFHEYAPQQVDPALFDYLEKLNPEATVSRPQWSHAGMSLSLPPREQWVSGDDDAVYWIENLFVKPYHKYTLVGTNDVKQTDWVPVSEELYENLYPYLGMEVASKPFGKFEEEASRVPAPPGISLVGDERYGRWDTDHSSGRRYWHYGGHYVYLGGLIPHRRYYRDEWDLWNGHYRGRKPYFGIPDKKEQIYGTGGSYVRTSSHYAGSHFGRTGGFSRPAPSIRGAGPGSRGRGPGGAGK